MTTPGMFEGAIVPVHAGDGDDPDFVRIDQARYHVHQEAMRPDLFISSMEQEMISKARLNSFFTNPDMFPTTEHPSTGPTILDIDDDDPGTTMPGNDPDTIGSATSTGTDPMED